MDSIAAEYHVCKGSVCLSIQGVENTLAPDGSFALPGKQQLKRKSRSIQYIVVDGTETRYTAPKEPQNVLFRNKNGARCRRRPLLSGIRCTSSMCSKPRAANMIARFITIPWERGSAIRFRLTPALHTGG